MIHSINATIHSFHTCNKGSAVNHHPQASATLRTSFPLAPLEWMMSLWTCCTSAMEYSLLMTGLNYNKSLL